MNSSHLHEIAPSYENGHSSACLEPENAESVLRELVQMLEEYGPSWYTEELHNRAVLALGGDRRDY